MNQERVTLGLIWRVLYSIALLMSGVLAWSSIQRSFSFALDLHVVGVWGFRVLLVALICGRLGWVWYHRESLRWPESPGLRTLSRLSLGATSVGIAAVATMFAAGGYAMLQADDVRGAVMLVVGIGLMPLIALLPLGLTLFECVSGWESGKSVEPRDRPLLWIAAGAGALMALAPWLSQALFPYGNLTRSQYRDAVPWLIFAAGVGALVAQGHRGQRFPSHAVFAWAATSYMVTSMLRLPPVQAALYASALALLPAATLRLSGRRTAVDRSTPAMLRIPVAVVASGAILLAGVMTGTDVMKPQPAMLSEKVMTKQQLKLQASLLDSVCRKAVAQVSRRVTQVSEIELRSPPDTTRNTMFDKGLPTYPDPTRPHKWFGPNMKGQPLYKVIVFSFSGGRRGYRAGDGGLGEIVADSASIHPRYVVTWADVETPEEAMAGFAGDEMSILDTEDNSVIARRITYFRRTNEHYGMFQDACGTLEKFPKNENYIYPWVSTVLVPG
jgi:hypothetical protein